MTKIEEDAELHDIGGLDWLVYEDEEGRFWFSPLLGLRDGQVYESRSHFGHDMYEIYNDKR